MTGISDKNGGTCGLKMILTMLYLTCISDLDATNLLQNVGFEEMDGGWDCWDIHCELTDDSHSGNFAWNVTQRNFNYQGPSQYVAVTQNTRYLASGYVKLLNDVEGRLFQAILLTIEFRILSESQDFINIVTQPTALAGNWVYMRGDLVTPTYSNVSAEGKDPNLVQIQVLQIDHAFPFGTAVAADYLLTGDSRYREYIYQHFNWAVIENHLKWSFMEPTQDQIDYDSALNAIAALRNNGLKIRGHTVVWAVDEHVPSWVKTLHGDSLKAAVATRIQGVVNATKGKLEHWDVINENLHGWFFQNNAGEFDYYLDIYRQVHNVDPDVLLFTNDYNVVSSGIFTQAYLNYITDVKNADISLGGIGVQSHFSDCPDLTLVKLRLDILAESSLSIFVTELDIDIADVNQRADCYENVLRIFYGHPSVQGILIWGFWSERHWKPNAALVTGTDFIQNVAGDRFLALIEDEWRTNVSRTLSQGDNFVVRGFKGDYSVKMTYQGELLTEKNITLGDTEMAIDMNAPTSYTHRMTGNVIMNIICLLFAFFQYMLL